MKKEDWQAILAFLKVFALRIGKTIGAVLLLVLPAAFAMIGVDALPRQWRLAASVVFVTAVVLGVSWAILVRGEALAVRRRARRRMLIVAVVAITLGGVSGLFASPAQDFVGVLPIIALVTGMVWIGLARRGKDPGP